MGKPKITAIIPRKGPALKARVKPAPRPQKTDAELLAESDAVAAKWEKIQRQQARN